MNLFIRTSIAPYRIDLYNALHKEGNFRMCFYRRVAKDQAFDPDWIESLCSFKPEYLGGMDFGGSSRRICTGIRRLIREENPDVVIVPEFQLVLFQVLLARGLTRKKFRIVSMCDDSYDMIANHRDFSALHRWLRRWVPRKVDEIITVTPPVRDWYREHFGKGLWMPIIRNGQIMRETFSRVLPESSRLIQEHGLEGKKVVGFVGRLVGLKNVDLLIRAFAEADVRDSVLVIIGDGPERASLEALSAGMGGRVVFTGRLEGDSLYAWYNVIGVLALLSSQEAFGAVVNEALLGGARVLVSQRAGASCLVEGENGRVVDIDDRDSITSALRSLLQQSETVPASPVLREDRMPFAFDTKIRDLIDALC